MTNLPPKKSFITVENIYKAKVRLKNIALQTPLMNNNTDFNNPCRKRQAYFIGIILIPLK